MKVRQSNIRHGVADYYRLQTMDAIFMFSKIDLNGVRIIVTGASSGIGWALAEQLAREKSRLILASRNQEKLDELARRLGQHGGEAHAVPTDVTDAGQRGRLIEAAVARWGGIDILINNAGVGAKGFFSDAQEDRLRRIFEVNFFAATELTRLVLPHLRQGKNPMVVNVSSILGRRAIPGCTEYCASKFALAGWSEGLRAELFHQGIHVLLVCPGRIITNFNENMIENKVEFGWQNHRAMTAERCARLIVRAIRRRQNELVITAPGKALVWTNRIAPRLLDYLLGRFSRK
jgi:short-subunit dehydrogenase